MLNFNLSKVAGLLERALRLVIAIVIVRVPCFFFLQIRFFFNGLGCSLNCEDSPTSIHLLSLEFHIYDLFHALNSDSMSTFILSDSYIQTNISHQTDQFLEASFFEFFLFSVSGSVFQEQREAFIVTGLTARRHVINLIKLPRV